MSDDCFYVGHFHRLTLISGLGLVAGIQLVQSYLIGRRCLVSLGWPPF